MYSWTVCPSSWFRGVGGAAERANPARRKGRRRSSHEQCLGLTPINKTLTIKRSRRRDSVHRQEARRKAKTKPGKYQSFSTMLLIFFPPFHLHRLALNSIPPFGWMIRGGPSLCFRIHKILLLMESPIGLSAPQIQHEDHMNGLSTTLYLWLHIIPQTSFE